MDGMESSNEDNCSSATAMNVDSAETSCLAEEDEGDPSESHGCSKQGGALEPVLKDQHKDKCSLEQKLCVFCNCGEQSLHGQRELKQFDPSVVLAELGNGGTNRTERESLRHESVLGVEVLSDELARVGFEQNATTVALFESTGHFWAHHWCAAWSHDVVQGEGQGLVNVDKAVISGISQKCEYCKRLGATIRCQMEGCLRSYHFPCAAASGSFQSMKTLTLLCPDHTDKAVQIAKDEANCGVCDAPGDLLDLLFCTSCGLHYHGACLEIVVTPVKRAGWQCPECKVCQTCRQPGADTMMLVCDACDKGYHTFCLKPAMESLPTDSWKCKNCRVCSDCGSRSAGKHANTQWHQNYSVCEKCYWQRNRDSAVCTICGKTNGQTDDTLNCHICQKWIHTDCGPSSLNLPGQQYTCATCKNSLQHTGLSSAEPVDERQLKLEPAASEKMKDLSEWTERQQKDLKPEQQLTSECSAEDSLHEHEDSINAGGNVELENPKQQISGVDAVERVESPSLAPLEENGVGVSTAEKETEHEHLTEGSQSSHNTEIHKTCEGGTDGPPSESIKSSLESTETEFTEHSSSDKTDQPEHFLQTKEIKMESLDQAEETCIQADTDAHPNSSIPQETKANHLATDPDLMDSVSASAETQQDGASFVIKQETDKIHKDKTELCDIPADSTCGSVDRGDVSDLVSDGMETKREPVEMDNNDEVTPMEVVPAGNRVKTEQDTQMEVQDAVSTDSACNMLIKSEIVEEMSNQSQTDSNSTCLEPDFSNTLDRDAGLVSMDVCMTATDDISPRLDDEAEKSNSDLRLTETEDSLPADPGMMKGESGKPAVMKRRFSPGRPRVKQGRCNSFPGKKRPRGGHVGRGRGRSRLKSVSGILESLGSTGVDTSPSKDDDDDDDTMHNTVVLFSTEDKFILLQDMCVVCGSFGRGIEGQLLACSQCGQCYHPYCVNSKITKVMLSKGWRCLECIVCEACGKASDPARLLLCDDCDISYHTYCLDPPLQTVPKGGWKCKWCVCCTQCGATTPGFHCEWQNNYTHCAPCGSLVTCPSCNEDYEEEDLLIQCHHCDRWVHAICENLFTEEEVEQAADEGFDCTACEPFVVRPIVRSESPVITPIIKVKDPDLIYSFVEPRFYNQDGVWLTESGMSQFRSMVLSPPHKKGPKPKLKNKPSNPCTLR